MAVSVKEAAIFMFNEVSLSNNIPQEYFLSF